MSHNTLTPKKLIISLSILFLIGYGVFNSRFLIKGPEITISGLDETGKSIKTESRDFSLKGTAVHSSYITINDRPISVDQTGNFNEKLLLSNGVSIIDVYARDKFGKEIRKKVDVVYEGEDETYASAFDTIVHASTSSSTSEAVVLNDDVVNVSLSSSFVSSTSTESQSDE